MANVIGTCDDQLWTTAGQAVILVGMLANIWFQWKSAGRQRQWQLEDKQQVKAVLAASATKIVNQTKEALDDQTEQLRTGMRTRLSDLGKQFDDLLAQEAQKRREGDAGNDRRQPG